MEMVLKPLIDLLVIVGIIVAFTGTGMFVLFLSVRNTIPREERVEIFTTLGDGLRYALWNLKWFFGGSEKKVAGWSVGAVIAAALLAAITQRINDGTWTLWETVGTVIGLAVTALIIGFLYCIFMEWWKNPRRY